MELAPGRIIDRYVVDGPLGKGGMASVFRARHTTLGTRHALKVLHGASPSIRARLLQEGRVQASLRHPCVVSVSDVIDVDGAPGLVMELVEGPSLDLWLAAERPSLAQIDALALDILDGIAAAHKLGLVHRDLKPGNVMLCVVDGRVRAKITDFGLAKVLAGDASGAVHTRSGSTLGTPAYMAPEQIRDAASVDARADVYALGALLYELATGRRAFDGDDMLDIFDRIRRGAYTPLSVVAPHLPERVAVAIDGALRPEPNDRWSDVERLRAAWTDGGVVHADPAAFSVVLVDRTLSMAPTLTDSAPPSDSTATFATSEVHLPPQVPPPTASANPIPLPSGGPSQPPRAPARTYALAGVGSLLIAALIGAAWVTWGRSPRPDVPGLAGVPALQGASAEADAAWREGWQALLDTEFRTAHRRLERVSTEVDDARVWGALAVTCGYESDQECARNAGARAITAHGPHDERFARLADAANQNMSDAAPWQLYLDEHPDDLLVALVAQQYLAIDTHERLLPFDVPDAPPLVAYARSQGVFAQQLSVDDAVALLDAAIERYPDAAVLRAGKGSVLLEDGDFPRALQSLKSALDDDPGLTWLWPAYGAAVRLAGDAAAAERITAQATAPEQPLSSRLLFWRQMAIVEAGRGHRGEALRLIDAADAAAIEAGAWSAALDVRDDRIMYAKLFDRDVAESLDALREAAAAPEVPVSMRDQVQQNIVAMDGELAANRGDLSAAETALTRSIKLGASAPRILSLKRAIAIARGDLGTLDALPLPDADTSCRTPIKEGLDRARAGAPQAALPWLQRGLDPALWCPPWGIPSVSRVLAYTALAEAHAQRGETASAHEAVANARAWWPDPDPDLAIVARLAAVDQASP